MTFHHTVGPLPPQKQRATPPPHMSHTNSVPPALRPSLNLHPDPPLRRQQAQAPRRNDDYLTDADGKFQELLTRPPSISQPQFPIPDYSAMPPWMQNIEDKITELQRMTRQFMLDTPFCSAMLDMGSGKTLATLSMLSIARPAGYILVIAPKAIAVNTWANEITDWNIPLRAVSLALSDTGADLTRAKRHKLYDKVRDGEYPPSVFVIGQDNIADLVTYFAHDWPFATVIIDEVQGFKNHTSKRFKAIKRVRSQITRMVQLTGTPVPNSLMDLWAPMYLLDEGAALGRNITSFRSRYFHETMLPNGGRTYRELDGSLSEVLPKISHLALASKNTELKLPELHIRDHYIDLDKDFYEEYRLFSTEQTIEAVTVALATNPGSPEGSGKDSNANGRYATPTVASVLSALEDEETIEATISADNAAILRMKKLQLASGTIYLDDNPGDDLPTDPSQAMKPLSQRSITDILTSGAVDEAGNPIDIVDLNQTPDHQLGYRTLFRCGNRIALNVHNGKIDVLVDIINQSQSPVLIAYHFRSDRDKIHHELRRRGIDAHIFNKKPTMFAAWNRREIPVMLIHPASAGHGLNLQHGGHTMVWYSLPDSLEHYMQANARLYRPGQKHDVTIHRLITSNTEDTEQPGRLRLKEIKQSIVLDALHHDPNSQNLDREEIIERALDRGEQRTKDMRTVIKDLDDSVIRDRIDQAMSQIDSRSC